jgi:hypothetical protein
MKGYELYQELPEDIRDKFKHNFKHYRLSDMDSLTEFLNEEFNSMDDFIGCSFLFSTTPEGHKFWNNLRGRADIKEEADEMHNLMLALISSLPFKSIKQEEENLDEVLSELGIKKSDNEL